MSSIREILKRIYFQKRLGWRLVYPLFSIHDAYYYNYLQDKKFLADKFRKIFDVSLNFEEPKTLNEKIQWLKINDRTPLHTLCADKYAVRSYIAEKIGEKYLVPLLLHTQSVEFIQPNNLPESCFVIKMNHNSGQVFIVKDKADVNWSMVRNKLADSFHTNHYHDSREWQYKNIEPRILVEKLLVDNQGKVLSDIKFCCINGRVEMIHVDSNKEVEHLRNNYTRDWTPIELDWPDYIKRNKPTEKPNVLPQLITLAETLAEPFCFVRVDFYLDKEDIFFGELTFHPTSGFGPMSPDSYDYELGSKLKLKKTLYT